jgi:HlyD family secretion protein
MNDPGGRAGGRPSIPPTGGAHSAPRRSDFRGRARRFAAAAAGVAALACTALACGRKADPNARLVQTAVVERQTIVIDAQATGVVEPIAIVEVKSKASGQITKMPVEVGDQARPGDLLVQLDTRDVRNQYNQALADVRAAQAQAEVARAQKRRSDGLVEQRVITTQEHEAATLTLANAEAQLVRARTNLDLAQQRLEDATVRAPVAGTIIEKAVSLGTVITSATGALGGGTTLLKMADLSQVRVRALVNETDIGLIRAGLTATVTVDAYPDRPFTGAVEKVEPQAVVQQSVTMFPVLVSIQNREGLLKPGMNGEVSVLVERRPNVLAVPNDAVRTPREAGTVAPLLGLNADSVRSQVQAQLGAVRGGGGRRGGSARGSGDAAAFPTAGPGPQDAPPTAGRRAPDATLDAPAEVGAGSGGRARPGLVFVAAGGRYEPRVVMLGLSNFDVTEVVRGLAEGDSVALLGVAALQAQRQQQNDRFRGMAGGFPGTQGGQRGGGGGRGGGGRP